MMEESHAGKGHDNTVLVGSVDNIVIAYAAAVLGDILNAALACTLNIVAKGEESIGANGDTAHSCYPFLFLFTGEDFRLNLEGLLPNALGENIFIFFGNIDVDGVVAVCAADAVHKLETKHLGMLTEHPVVGLAACKTGAVDAALLTCTDADGLAILDVADRVGLGVLQGDEAQKQVVLSFEGKLLVLGYDISEKLLIYLEAVISLLESDAVYMTALNGIGLIIGIDLYDVVSALFLTAEDLESFVGVSRGDNAVGYLLKQIAGGGFVAGVAESGPVSIRAETVSSAGLDICTGDGTGIAAVGKIDLLFYFGKRSSESGSGGGDVLERCRGGKSGCLLQSLDQLPGVKGVHEVDIAGFAVENGQRKLFAVIHENLRGLLIGVAAVFKFKFLHCSGLLMFVDYYGVGFAAAKVNGADKEGDLVVSVEGGPYIVG